MRAGQLFDIFSTEEIDFLLRLLNKLSDAPNQGKFKAYTNGFTPGELTYDIINRKVVSKIEKLLERKITVTCGMFLKEQRPWYIHTDYVHVFDGSMTPDLAIVIPLKIFAANDQSNMTHTVVFNEICTNTFEQYWLDNSKIKNHAKHIEQSHCDHCQPGSLEYVSLQGIYPWHLGSVIYWDRDMLHCSDNFVKNNIKEKQALVLFSAR